MHLLTLTSRSRCQKRRFKALRSVLALQGLRAQVIMPPHFPQLLHSYTLLRRCSRVPVGQWGLCAPELRPDSWQHYREPESCTHHLLLRPHLPTLRFRTSVRPPHLSVMTFVGHSCGKMIVPHRRHRRGTRRQLGKPQFGESNWSRYVRHHSIRFLQLNLTSRYSGAILAHLNPYTAAFQSVTCRRA